MPELDLLTVGRANMDLYAQEEGVEFADAAAWNAMVGGSPTNVAIAAARLGVSAGVLTGVGEDLVGDWVLRALYRERVDTSYVVRKRGPHTSLALRAQVPPDHPLAFYRHDPADIHVTVDDAAGAPVERTPAVLVSADALARGSMTTTALSVVRRARRVRTAIYLDLDLREVNWPDLGTYADTVSLVIDDIDVVLGTETEFAALLGHDPAADALAGEVGALPAERQDLVVVLKQGARGATIFTADGAVELPAFPVTEVSSVGAGDSFAGGLLAARLRNRDWEEAGRYASACAGITVSRPGCSAGFPRLEEVEEFLTAAPAGSYN